jgi:hypothetical protein
MCGSRFPVKKLNVLSIAFHNEQEAGDGQASCPPTVTCTIFLRNFKSYRRNRNLSANSKNITSSTEKKILVFRLSSSISPGRILP